MLAGRRLSFLPLSEKACGVVRLRISRWLTIPKPFLLVVLLLATLLVALLAALPQKLRRYTHRLGSTGAVCGCPCASAQVHAFPVDALWL